MKKSNIILIIILIIMIIVINALPIYLLSAFKGSKDIDYHQPEDYNLTAKEVNLITDDDLNLKAWQIDDEKPKGMIIFLSGTNDRSVTSYFPHAKMMKEEGYSSLLLETRAYGKSEGKNVTLGFEEVIDVKAATTYIKNSNNYKDLPIVVFGTSMGGATAINSLGKIDDLDGVISLSSFSSPEDTFEDLLVNRGLPNSFIRLEKKIFKFYLQLYYGTETIKSSPIYNIMNIDNKPILLMHSEGDSQVPFNSLKRLVNEADKYSDNVRTHIVEGDKHLIVNEDDFNNPSKDLEYCQAIFNFLNEFF